MNVQENNQSHIVRNLALGTLISGGSVAYRAFKKENRADSFVNTSKKCLNAYTNSNKDMTVYCLNKVKLNKAADWMNKVSNKKLCAAFLAGGILLNSWLAGGIVDLFKK